MTDRPKDWEILKALEEGREVRIGGTTYHDAIVNLRSEDGYTLHVRLLDDEEAHIEPPTSYTLEEAAAAFADGKEVYCCTAAETGLLVEAIERTVDGSVLVVLTSPCPKTGGTEIIRRDISDIGRFYRAPPEPSIEDLMRAHDPVSNPTVCVHHESFDEDMPPRLVISRLVTIHSRFRGFVMCGSPYVGEWDAKGHQHHHWQPTQPKAHGDIRACSPEEKALYAEWAKGQQS